MQALPCCASASCNVMRRQRRPRYPACLTPRVSPITTALLTPHNTLKYTTNNMYVVIYIKIDNIGDIQENPRLKSASVVYFLLLMS